MEKRTVYEREIVFDPETRDFAMYLDGELIGFARNFQEAEITLDKVMFELLNGGFFGNGEDYSINTGQSNTS